MMEKRKITLQDRDALERLIAEVENSLKNEYFWLPIKEEARKHLLDPLIKDLLDIARQRGIECVLATIHPENVPSQRLFQKAGLEKMCTYTKDVSYIRDVYVIRLKQ